MNEHEQSKVFLSHNSRDKPAVEVMKMLLERGDLQRGERPIPCWFDKDGLRSQGTWMSQLEDAVAACGAAVVFYGPDGHGPVHKYEIDLLVKRAMYEQGRDAIRLVLVLLPGAQESAIQGFVSLHMWADFRKGLDDAAALQRLRAFILGVAPTSGPGDDPLIPKPEIEPYRGLEAFDGKHASYFFGRDDEIKELCGRLHEWPFTAVIGASGSGKSSVVRAGLQTDLAKKERPALTQTATITVRPGTNPIHALAEQVAASQSGQSAAERLKFVDDLDTRFRTRPDALLKSLTSLFVGNEQQVLLVIDQFEELFTHSTETQQETREGEAPAEPRASDNFLTKPSSPGSSAGNRHQTQFVELLAAVVKSELDRLRIVITLRADFFDRCLNVSTLKSLIENRTLLLGKLSDDALRTVIEMPAFQVRAYFEKGLVARILKDVENQNGSLPLLQHALKELWEKRRFGFLTADAYDETGGVEGALKKRANATLQNLSEFQREIAKNIFLRLTTLGEGVSDTRRRVRKNELYPEKSDPRVIDEVLKRLSSQTNRLIVTNDDGTVEVTHEALIQRWDTLKGWLAENRDRLRQHRRISESAAEWVSKGRATDVPTYLLIGARLEVAEELAESGDFPFNKDERDYLDGSRAYRQRLLDEAAAEVEKDRLRQQRELAQAREFAEAEAARATAEMERAKEAEARKREALRAARRQKKLTRLANSRRLSAQSLLHLNHRLDLSLLLSAAAAQIHPTLEARSALFQAIQSRPWLTAFLPCPDQCPNDVAFSPDGSRLAVTTASGLEIWDIPSRTCQATIPKGDADFVRGLAFSPDGRVVAAGFSNGLDKGGYVALWTLESRHRLEATFEVPGSAPEVVRFSPDGKTLAAGFQVGIAEAGGVLLWDFSDQVAAPHVFEIEEAGVEDIVFTPDGKTLVAACSSATRGNPPGSIVLWDLKTRKLRGDALPVWEGFARSVSIHPDGNLLAAGFDVKLRDEGGVILWDLSTLERRGQPEELKQGAVSGVQFSPDGNTLAAAYGNTGAASDGVAIWELENRLWQRPAPDLRILEGSLNRVAYSPDGQSLAATIVSPSAILLCHLQSTRTRPQLLAVPEGIVRAAAVSPDEKTLAVAFDFRLQDRSAVIRFDLTSNERLGPVMEISKGSISSLAYSRDGVHLVAGVAHGKPPVGRLIVWELTDNSLFRREASVSEGAIRDVAFSPTGKTVAAGFATVEGTSAKGGVLSWEFPSLKRIRPDYSTPEGPVEAIGYSSDGTSLSAAHTGHGGGVVLINLETGVSQNYLLPEAYRRINSIRYEFESGLLVLGLVVSGLSNKGQIDIFELTATNGLGLSISVDEAAIACIEMAPDSMMIAAGWQVPGGVEREFGGITGPDSAAVLLIDPATGQRMGPQLDIAPGVRAVTCLHFTRSSNRLFAGYGTYYNEGGVGCFDVDLKSWLQIAKSVTNRNFSAVEWKQFFSNEPYRKIFEDLPDGFGVTRLPKPQAPSTIGPSRDN